MRSPDTSMDGERDDNHGVTHARAVGADPDKTNGDVTDSTGALS